MMTMGGGMNPFIWYLTNDLVSVHEGLGCIPIKTPKIKKRIIKAIILTRLETFLFFRSVMAATVTMRYERYLYESIS